MKVFLYNDLKKTFSKLAMRKATKCKPLKVKHVQSLLTDNFILDKLSLSTLEGTQDLRTDSIVCRGVTNDVWQQDPEKFFNKYDITGFDERGWMIATPKPGNVTLAYQTNSSWPQDFLIQAQWGKDYPIAEESSGVSKNIKVQAAQRGDYVMRTIDDDTDYYICAKIVFENSYEFLE